MPFGVVFFLLDVKLISLTFKGVFMGCRELEITDYYRFLEPGEKSYMRPSDCEEKTAYIAIFCEAIVDNWNLIGVFDATDTLTKSYLWGEDSLIAETNSSGTYLALQDGNKNIVGYIDSSDGTSVADYEYSPFGKLIVSTGTMADNFNFKFSSYYTDDETDLVYYGYRYYDAETGRFLNRDPIGEEGGENLYAMCSNNLISYVDFLGLKQILFTLLVGPQLGDMNFMWNIVRDKAIKKTKGRKGQDTICFKYVGNASSKDVTRSVENGYGFIFAHGGLYYLDTPLLWEGTLEQAIKKAQQKAGKMADKEYQEALKKWKLAKRRYERKTNQKLIEEWRKWRLGLRKRKPRRQPYPNPGFAPELKEVTVTEDDLEVKAMLSDKFARSSEMLSGKPKNPIASWIKFYGCYAGLMQEAKSHGITVSAGHSAKRNIRAGIGKPNAIDSIEKDINALLDGDLSNYRVIKD